MPNITLFTIGFTKKSAPAFFTKLKRAGVTKVIDVRLRNISQLAGFSKRDDLIFFLGEICRCDYRHIQYFAPTEELFVAFKKKHIDWAEYERIFSRLIEQRAIENLISPAELDNTCLLCSEPTPDHCHRRLVAEYLQGKLENIEITHL